MDNTSVSLFLHWLEKDRRVEKERGIREVLVARSGAIRRHKYPTQIQEITILRHHGTKVFHTMTSTEGNRKKQMKNNNKNHLFPEHVRGKTSCCSTTAVLLSY